MPKYIRNTQPISQRKLKSIIQPTNYQKSILYGTVLGDTYITFRRNMQIEQALSKKQYVDWLFTQLKSLTTGKGPTVVPRYDKRTKKYYFGYRFYTQNLFREWRDLFYDDNKKKRLPHDFVERLDEIALAIWFLDDGCKCTNVKRGVFITLDSYSLQEIDCIQRTLLERFGIASQLGRSGESKSGNAQWRITIAHENYDKLLQIIGPIVYQIPSMVELKLVKD